jgi:hypothetical protein
MEIPRGWSAAAAWHLEQKKKKTKAIKQTKTI